MKMEGYCNEMLLILCLLVVLDIISKWMMRRDILSVLHRVQDLLELNEKHGKLDDQNVKKITDAANRSAGAAVVAVKNAANRIIKEVPTITAEEVTSKGGGSQDGTGFPIPKIPPI